MTHDPAITDEALMAALLQALAGDAAPEDGAEIDWAEIERRSGYLETDNVPDRRSDTVMKAIQRQLQRHPAELRRSCTFDNGPEFTLHAVLKRKLGEEAALTLCLADALG